MQFPEQRLTKAQKIEKYGSEEKWGQYCVDAIERFAGEGPISTMHSEMQELFDLSVGKFNIDDLRYVTNAYGLEDVVYPARMRHWDIISPILNLLHGEEIKRPFTHRVYVSNREAITEQETTEARRHASILIMQWQMQHNGQMQYDDQGNPVMPDYIQQMANSNSQDERETMAHQTLEYLKDYLSITEVLADGWRDMITSRWEVYYTGAHAGDPVLRRVDPRFFTCERSVGTKYIHDSSWTAEWRYLTVADCIDEYYDALSEDDFSKLEQLGREGLASSGNGPVMVIDDRDNNFVAGSGSIGGSTLVRVFTCTWKSRRKVGLYEFINEHGQPDNLIVDDTFKPKKGDKVTWTWINEVYEGTAIGNASLGGNRIYVNIRPRENQYRSLDNPSKCRLPYTGLIYPTSIVQSIKSHQYLYNIVMYRLELLLARAKGKGFVMDVAQIPKQFLGTNALEKWLYYFGELGVAFINSFEEGNGTFAGQKPQFNQFTTFDLTISQAVGQYIEILNKVEELVGQISGVSKQRLGQVDQNELVGNVQQTIVQSSHITEPMFYAHNQVKRRVLENLIQEAKLAWPKGKKARYILDDGTLATLNIDPDKFPTAEYGVFVGNSTREQKMRDKLDQLVELAVQRGDAKLFDIVRMMKSDSIIYAEHVLQEAEMRSSQEKQQEMQAQQQQVQMQIQAQQQQAMEEMKFKYADLQTKKQMNDDNNATKVKIALLSEESADMDRDGIPDALELRKLDIQAEKARGEMGLKAMKQSHDQSMDKEKSQAEKEKLRLQQEAIKNKNSMDMQSQKQRMKLEKTKHDDDMELRHQELIDERLLKHEEHETGIEIAREKADAEIEAIRIKAEAQAKAARETAKIKAQQDPDNK